MCLCVHVGMFCLFKAEDMDLFCSLHAVTEIWVKMSENKQEVDNMVLIFICQANVWWMFHVVKYPIIWPEGKKKRRMLGETRVLIG